MSRPRLVRRSFTTAGTSSFVVPGGVTAIFALGCGGGGGGGGGASNVTPAPPGGGGGGASLEMVLPLAVTPGSTLYVTVGASGAGGAAGTTGSAGGDSFISTASGSVTTQLACWPGGGPGIGATGSGVSVQGGIPVRDGVGASLAYGSTYNGFHGMPGRGGYGNPNASPGQRALYGGGGTPGAAGQPGTPTTSGGGRFAGGGGGGGGGGTALGSNGGAGGLGGNPNDAGAGGNGGAGGAGTGFGSGGGGGGAGAVGSTVGGTGGVGGAGASGRVVVWWWE